MVNYKIVYLCWVQGWLLVKPVSYDSIFIVVTLWCTNNYVLVRLESILVNSIWRIIMVIKSDKHNADRLTIHHLSYNIIY